MIVSARTRCGNFCAKAAAVAPLAPRATMTAVLILAANQKSIRSSLRSRAVTLRMLRIRSDCPCPRVSSATARHPFFCAAAASGARG